MINSKHDKIYHDHQRQEIPLFFMFVPLSRQSAYDNICLVDFLSVKYISNFSPNCVCVLGGVDF